MSDQIDINTEFVIVYSLLKHKEYLKKVYPYLDPSFFVVPAFQRISRLIKAYYTKYPDRLVPISALTIYFKEKDKKILEDELKDVLTSLQTLDNYKPEDFSEEYLLEITEEYFRKRALYNALIEAESIYQDKPNNVNTIPDIIQKALSMCFDNSIGHDYFEDSEKALEHYHNTQIKFPTHLKRLNDATGGGLAKGKLHVFLAQPGGGKSRLLVDLCSHYAQEGMNCLFVSLELSTMDIRQRFDANLMDIDINSFPKIEKERFLSKLKLLKSKTNGKIIIQHYPSGSVNCNHIRNLLGELKAKKNFIPDVIAIDYIMLLDNIKPVGPKLYEMGKQISAEIVRLFDEANVIGLAPNQLNRGGWNTSEVVMANIADSAGIMQNADFVAAISGTDELIDEHKFLMQILKNRLYSLGKNRKFILGFDDYKMRHFDVDQQEFSVEKTPTQEIEHLDKSKFKGWKF